MEKITNWVELWRQLVEAQGLSHRGPGPSEKSPPKVTEGAGKSGWQEGADPWQKRARHFDSQAHKRKSETGAIRQIVAERLGDGATIVDIGAGTGRWTSLLAKRAAKVTAVEPSPAMIAVLRERLLQEGLANVDVVQAFWPDVEIPVHDIAFCSHSVYFSPDLPKFVKAMVAVARRSCYLMLRAPLAGSVMAEAAQHVWGQPHDSPNFVIGFNILLDMGITPNVIFDNDVWEGWRSPSLEAALEDTKRRLGILDQAEHDEFLRDLLRHELTLQDGEYAWPPAIRSALVYWDISQ